MTATLTPSTGRQTDARPDRTGRLLAPLLGAALALRVGLALVVDPAAPVLDERAYLDLARTLAAEGRFEGTFRPPLYPAFLALFLELGLGTLGARLAQAVLGTLAAWLVFRLAARALGSRVAVVAAAVVAFDPVLVSFSHRLWSETLFIVLVLAALDLLARSPRGWSVRSWAMAGILLGLAALTRPMIVTFLPFLLLWALTAGRRGEAAATGAAPWRPTLERCVALGLACAVVILPWTWRNVRATGAFILIDSNGPFNLLVGAQPEAAFVDKDDRWSERFGRVDGQAYQELVAREAGRAQALAMQEARDHIARAPGRFVRKSLWEAGHLWTLDSFLLRHLRNGWYGAVPGWAVAAITVGSVVFFLVLVLGALVGWAAGRPSPLRALSLLLVAHSTLLFGATYALSRYSVPLRPLLAVWSAVALVGLAGGGRAWLRGRLAPPARLAIAAMFLALGLAWLRDLPLLADMLRNQGRGHRFVMERLSDAR